jgi:hypothetical protein
MATYRARSALEAEAVTPETQAAAAARDGFVTYDELREPDLDAARWSPARLPPDRPATFAVDLAVANIGGDPGDYRRAGPERAVAPVPGTRGRRVSRTRPHLNWRARG